MLRVRDDETDLAAAARDLCLGIDDFNKLWFEGGSAHKETVNILLGSKLFAGSTSHRT